MAAMATTISDSATAAEYRDKFPLLPSKLYLYKSKIMMNIESLSLHQIKHNRWRLELETNDYVKLAIMGCKAFLAASDSLGASAELKSFIRHDELPKLRDLLSKGDSEHPFVEAMKNNNGWVDSLLRLLEELLKQEE